MSLRIVTLCNDESADQLSFLRQSCLEQGLHLEVLGDGVRWTRNALKFRLLDEFLKASDDEDELILVVDAFDVIVNAGPEEILSKYQRLHADIIFSAEANYYFREPDLSLYYWWYYPRREQTIYQYLNSGTFMGPRWALRSLLKRISETYRVDYQDDAQLAQVRSDQYLYSRFFADYKLNVVQTDFTMELDAYQELFGCSGGRMAVMPWPRISWIQDYLFFKYERRMLKTFWLKETQEYSRDLSYEKRTEVFYNQKTATEPAVIHLPGTYRRFGFILHKLKTGSGFSGWNLAKPLAYIISLIAYIRSVINSLYIKIISKGKVDIEKVFPVVLDAGKRVTLPELIKHLKDNIPLVHVVKAPEVRFIPQIISFVRERQVGIIASEVSSVAVLKRLGMTNIQMMIPDDLESSNRSVVLAKSEIILILVPVFSEERLQELYNRHKATTFIDISVLNLLLKSRGQFPKDNPFSVKL